LNGFINEVFIMSRPETTGRAPLEEKSIWVYWPEMLASGRVKNRPGAARQIAAGLLPAPRQVGPNSIAWLRAELEENERNLPRHYPKAHGFTPKKVEVA
jgi:predicted DNA-binding transcriptional regulator AlpA